MSRELPENELSQWYSTYGLITAERVLGKYQIQLTHDELLMALKTPPAFYHRLLEIPMKNILNGIVLQQANDYLIYAQKLFIDYLLSPECAKEDSAQGASTRESLENERQQLVLLGEEFHKKRAAHEYLIANSQATLIRISKNFNEAFNNSIGLICSVFQRAGFEVKKIQARQAINHALIHIDLDVLTSGNSAHFVEKMTEALQAPVNTEIKEKLVNYLEELLEVVSGFQKNIYPFHEEVLELSSQSNAIRKQFHEAILRILDLMKLLSEYKIDPNRDAINRESLYFDNSIGSL